MRRRASRRCLSLSLSLQRGLLNEWNIPIWVMEPLRGGKLAKLDAASEDTLKALRPYEEIPAWAFRFLQSVPGVTMILSGMSSMALGKLTVKQSIGSAVI